MILNNKIFLDIVVKNSNKYITKIDNVITLKQRVSPESLNILNKVAKINNTSRDLIVMNSLIILYENLREKFNEDIKLIAKFTIKLKNLIII